MQVPLEVTFHNCEHLDDIEQLVREKTDSLEKVCDHIISCRVAIEQPHKHHHKGNAYRVRIYVTATPKHELFVEEEPTEEKKDYSLKSIVQKAFKTMQRRLKKLNEEQHGQVKSHPNNDVEALVEKIFPQHGFLRTLDTDEQIFFNRKSVINEEFERLKPGTGVHAAYYSTEDGYHASTVKVVQPK
ncbi:MAG: HPF/RaiA family ribosome-associated protein [Candidatus Omnitrophota bacterium]